MTKLNTVFEEVEQELDNLVDELRDRIMKKPTAVDIQLHARLMFTYNVLIAYGSGYEILKSGLVKTAIVQLVDSLGYIDLMNVLEDKEPDNLIVRLGDIVNKLVDAYNDTIDELELEK